MTTQEKVRATLFGEIADIALKIGTKGEYCEMAVRQDGREYPAKCRAFDPDLVNQLKQMRKGDKIGLEIEETQGQYQGKKITYRNIVGILVTPAPAPEKVKPLPKLPTVDEMTEPIHDARYWANRDQRGLEIAWGQAINCAVARMGVGALDDSYFEVMEQAANRFYPIILGGPQMPLPPETMGLMSKEIAGRLLLTRDGVIAYAKTLGYGDKVGMAQVEGVTTAMRTGDFAKAVELLKAAKEKV